MKGCGDWDPEPGEEAPVRGVLCQCSCVADHPGTPGRMLLWQGGCAHMDPRSHWDCPSPYKETGFSTLCLGGAAACNCNPTPQREARLSDPHSYNTRLWPVSPYRLGQTWLLILTRWDHTFPDSDGIHLRVRQEGQSTQVYRGSD